jgi:hypothetical protein
MGLSPSRPAFPLCFGMLSYGTGTILVGNVSDHLADELGLWAVCAGIASTLLPTLAGLICFARAFALIRRGRRRILTAG